MRSLGFLLVLIGHFSFGQNALDSTSIKSTISWLERKMTFNYFDPTNQHWWVNRLQSNDNGSYTIKNIAAQHPDKVLEKKYHNRTFNLYDINPNAITVIDLTSDQGRFVKGKIVRAECFKGESSILVKKDGIVGSKVSFIHVSVPQALLDSTESYAKELKEKLREAAYLDARLFNSNNLEENVNNAFKSFRGKYISDDSTTYLNFEVIDVRLIRFKLKRENQLFVGTIGFDLEKESIYLFMAGNEHYSTREFSFASDETDLVLQAKNERLHVLGRNTLSFSIKELSGKFFRY